MKPLQTAFRHALSYLDQLDNARVGATATLDELRQRFDVPLTADGVDGDHVIDGLMPSYSVAVELRPSLAGGSMTTSAAENGTHWGVDHRLTLLRRGEKICRAKRFLSIDLHPQTFTRMTPPAALYRFGPFTLDLEAAELRKGLEKLPIRPKCLDLLRYLLEHPKSLITKETLLAKVWSDAVVCDATLTRTVAELRSVLRDDPRNPRYIETVARRGYKLVADAEQIVGASPPDQSAKANFILIHKGKAYQLADGDHVIGRVLETDVPLPSILVSRQHARLHVDGMTVWLEDLGSRNGTFVNGEQIKTRRSLAPGDKIRIGEETLLLWWSQGAQTAPGRSTPPRR